MHGAIHGEPAAACLLPGRRAFKLSARFFICGLLAVLVGGFNGHGAVNVTQYHNHLSRDGLYIDPGFTTNNSAGLTRDTNFNGAIIGNVYAQPLYIEGGPGGQAVIIAVTESNNVFSLDATSGEVIWRTNVGPPVPPNSLPCGNVSPYGITGTPVVDLPSRNLFFDALTPDTVNRTVKHLIYSMKVDTGAVNPGWPINVNNSAVYNGTNKFNSLAQGERGALTIIGTNLYVPYGGLFGDCSTYFGWVVGVPINNPSNVMAWSTRAKGGGAWAVGGIASDGVDPFVATGNTFGASTWGGGEAVVHLSPSLALAEGTSNYWAPTNWSSLDGADLDIGGSGPLLVNVPGANPSNLVVALGKDGNAYLLNRTNLGGVARPIAQASVATSQIIQAAVTYTTASGTYVVFANGGSLHALHITATPPPAIAKAWTASQNGNGSPFVTSTDGTSNYIVWGFGAEGDGRLHAFNGDTGATIFTGGSANEAMTGTRHLNTGIVARGRIYVANDNKVYAFSVPEPQPSPITLTSMVIQPGGAFQFSFTNVSGANFYVYANTNLAAPITSWSPLGLVPEVSSGLYQFTDTNEPANAERFYYVNSP